MPIFVGQGGSWKKVVPGTSVGASGAWKRIKGIWVGQGGQWKRAFQDSVIVTVGQSNDNSSFGVIKPNASGHGALFGSSDPSTIVLDNGSHVVAIVSRPADAYDLQIQVYDPTRSGVPPVNSISTVLVVDGDGVEREYSVGDAATLMDPSLFLRFYQWGNGLDPVWFTPDVLKIREVTFL